MLGNTGDTQNIKEQLEKATEQYFSDPTFAVSLVRKETPQFTTQIHVCMYISNKLPASPRTQS